MCMDDLCFSFKLRSFLVTLAVVSTGVSLQSLLYDQQLTYYS